MDIGSLYTDYLKSTVTSSSNLERTLNGANAQKSDDELLDACKQFETYFYEQVFKGMEKAMVPKDDSDPNNTIVDYYKEQVLSKYSEQIVEQSGDNSLAQQLYQQMKRNYAVPGETVEAAEVAATATATAENTDSSVDSSQTEASAISGVSEV